MAGLFAVIGNTTPERIKAASHRLSFFNDEQRFLRTDRGCSFTWVSSDDPELFEPARDKETGVCIATAGRVAWDEAEWKRAEALERYDGGLSNKLLLERYLRSGVYNVERQNGAAGVLIWDPRDKTVHLLSDHFGYQSLFVYRPYDVDGCIIASSPDVIAADGEARVSPDYVSMAEFLRAWRATPPHTYYKEIKYVGAASHWRWDIEKRTCHRRTYWQPFQEAPFPDIETAASELTEALRNAIRIRTLPRLGPVACYVSGGMDSRTVLFSTSDPSGTIGVNLYDVPNRESAVAKSLCDAAGVTYVGVARDEDYYPRWMSEGARLSNGMWSVEDNHFLGTRALIRDLKARTVMTACTTDWLFKGYGLEKTYEQLFGRNLPLKKFTDERVDGFLPNYPREAPSEYADEIHRRMAEWFDGTPRQLKSDRDRLLVEDRRVRPTCYAVSVSGQVMYRAFPYDTFLADRAVADCYSRSAAAWKLNSDMFGLAVKRLCAGGSGIVDANFGWRIGSGRRQKLFRFGVGWLRRRLRPARTLNGGGLATDGSWPNIGWYVRNSRTLSEMWENTPTGDRELMTCLWGSNPWKVDLERWASNPNDLFRILTLLNHWNSRRRSAATNEVHEEVGA